MVIWEERCSKENTEEEESHFHLYFTKSDRKSAARCVWTCCRASRVQNILQKTDSTKLKPATREVKNHRLSASTQVSPAPSSSAASLTPAHRPAGATPQNLLKELVCGKQAASEPGPARTWTGSTPQTEVLLLTVPEARGVHLEDREQTSDYGETKT